MAKREGFDIPSENIKYNHSYPTDEFGNAIGADTSDVTQTITFYATAFRWNYRAIVSIMDHEYFHYQWTRDNGRFYETDSIENNVHELGAYQAQMRSANFRLAPLDFQTGTIGSTLMYTRDVIRQVQQKWNGCSDISQKCG